MTSFKRTLKQVEKWTTREDARVDFLEMVLQYAVQVHTNLAATNKVCVVLVWDVSQILIGPMNSNANG